MTKNWKVGPMISIINSTFENSLRIILLLNNSDTPMRQERLVYLDFITCYSKDFGFAESINGKNSSKKSEITLRRKKIKNAISELVINGFVKPLDRQNGRFFEITSSGKLFADSLSSEYGNKYRAISKTVLYHFSNKTDKELLDLILD